MCEYAEEMCSDLHDKNNFAKNKIISSQHSHDSDDLRHQIKRVGTKCNGRLFMILISVRI